MIFVSHFSEESLNLLFGFAEITVTVRRFRGFLLLIPPGKMLSTLLAIGLAMSRCYGVWAETLPHWGELS